MIKSMTGFAEERFSLKEVKGTAEIKSLNNRYFDLVCHLPIGFSAFEERIKKIFGEKLKRGRVTVLVNFLSKPFPKIILNQPLAKEYLLSLKKLKKSLKLKGEISLAEITKLAGVFVIQENHLPAAALWKGIESALIKALNNLLKSRAVEGKFLCRDISGNIKQIRISLKQMQKAAEAVTRNKSRFLCGEELASFLKSSNIDEEITRLKFHLNTLEQRLKSNDSVGKELDFICQELLREVNTSGAKLADKAVSGCAIKIKSDIEKIREQVQNIE